jgi:hypothetical protein
MRSLRLAIRLADLAAESTERGEPLDARSEAKRLLRDHPEADHTVEEVAAVLKEEVVAAKGPRPTLALIH